MLVRYVAGYGRSASTALAAVLAAESGGTNVGEVAHIVRRELTPQLTCSCGEQFGNCAYWGAILVKLQEMQHASRRRALRSIGPSESWLGLLVPTRLIRYLVHRRSFSLTFPSVTFFQGIELLANQAGGVMIDSSKTTRLTANRPRLLAACGLTVEVHGATRDAAGLVDSYRAAANRSGSATRARLARIAALTGRSLADASAWWCAHRIGTVLNRREFGDVVAQYDDLALHHDPGALSHDHLFGGNRRQLRGAR